MSRQIPILKTTIQHLKTANKTNLNEDSDYWNIELSIETNSKVMKEEFMFKSVWIQGAIEQVTADDIFLVNDFSGKAKIIDCKQAVSPLDRQWTSSGANNYCSIIGTLIQIRGIPEIKAERIIPLTLNSDEPANHLQILKSLWPSEVKDLHMYFLNVTIPRIL